MTSPALSSAAPQPFQVVQLNSMLSGGGTDDQCVKLCAELGRLGVPVTLAGPDGREFTRVARELSVPFRATPQEGPLKFRFILAAAHVIRDKRAAIVHGHHGRDIWPTLLAARLSGIRPKIVLTRHLAKSPGAWISRRFVLGQLDALIAVSEFVARVLRQGHYEPDSPVHERHSRPPMAGDHAKIRVIHGGIDALRFQPQAADFEPAQRLREQWGARSGDFVFGVVGGYDLPRGKGQREFLAAAAQIAGGAPSARFVIVGRGNMAELLQADITRLGLGERASIAPYCRDMPAAMNALDCLVHPQIGTEAFPGVVLEALACGRPVIASDLDGIPEAFAACPRGRLVKPESIGELATAMRDQMSGPPPASAERQAMHAEVARRFALSVVAVNVLRLYEELLKLPQVAGSFRRA